MSAPAEDQQAQHVPPTGEIAVHNGLLGREHLEECLAIQQDMADRGYEMKIGQIMIERGYMDQRTLRAILKASGSPTGKDDAEAIKQEMIKFTDSEHQILIDKIRSDRLVASGEILKCLDLQCELGKHKIEKSLGEILMGRGLIDHALVEQILTDAAAQRD